LQLSISSGYTLAVTRVWCRTRTLFPCLVVALATFGCGDPSGNLPSGDPLDQIAGFSGRPTMNPGLDCASCHSPTGRAHDRLWTVSGTVFSDSNVDADAGVAEAYVLITDVNGKQLTLRTNEVGNFYTSEPLGALTDVEVQRGPRRLIMNLAVFDGGDLSVIGSCNHCHQNPGINGAPGRIFIPRQ
jgi:hypothetical protein